MHVAVHRLLSSNVHSSHAAAPHRAVYPDFRLYVYTWERKLVENVLLQPSNGASDADPNDRAAARRGHPSQPAGYDPVRVATSDCQLDWPELRRNRRCSGRSAGAPTRVRLPATPRSRAYSDDGVKLLAGERADRSGHLHVLPARRRQYAARSARVRAGHAPEISHLRRAEYLQAERRRDDDPTGRQCGRQIHGRLRVRPASYLLLFFIAERRRWGDMRAKHTVTMGHVQLGRSQVMKWRKPKTGASVSNF
jgi:hypothetical protein